MFKMEDTTYVIYDVGDCGFRMSIDFTKELTKRLNIAEDMEVHTWDKRYRTNQTACNLLREKGSYWSSGCDACLQLCKVPTFLIDYIEINSSGDEEIVTLNKYKYASNLMRKTLDNPTSEEIENMKKTLDRLDKATVEPVYLSDD